MLAASQAGMAFSNASVALVHGMSRPIGAHFHVAHGLSNAMLLPAVTAFSVAHAPQRYATCARVMGWAAETDSDDTACSKLIAGLRALNDDLEVPSPTRLGHRADDAMLQLMADQALASAEQLVTGLTQTASNLTEAGAAWQATFLALGLGGDEEAGGENTEASAPDESDAPPAEPSRPFDILEYRDTAIELERVAVELRGLVCDVQGLTAPSGEDAPLNNVEVIKRIDCLKNWSRELTLND